MESETAWRVTIASSAQKYLDRLDRIQRDRFSAALVELAVNPLKLDIKRLKGRSGWRLRVGNYRALLQINFTDRIVEVTFGGPRGDVYK